MNDIYAGDKAMRLNLGIGRRLPLRSTDPNAVRTPSEWNGGWHGGFSSPDPEKLNAPLIQDPLYGHAAVSVLSQTKHSVPNGMGRITAVRKMTPALGSGSIGSLSSQLQGYWPTCESWEMTRSWWSIIF
jgi:hypothetical protein